MLSKCVGPGNRVEIVGILQGESGRGAVHKTGKVFQSQVYDILSEDKLEIVMPMEKTKLVLLPIDSEYELYFYTENGLYQCYARITERYKTDNVYLVAMELISNLGKYQRREFYRLGCAIDMRIRKLLDIELQDKKKEEVPDSQVCFDKAIIVDISGGGIRCVGKNLYEEDANVLMEFSIVCDGKVKDFTVKGKVLNSTEIENRQEEYEHRIKFQDIRMMQREDIIRYIFLEERKYRKREIGD